MPASPLDDTLGVDLSTSVVVALGEKASTPAGDHRALVDLVARLTGVPAASVSLGQECPHCGAAGHGPLRVRFGDGASPVPAIHVSLARCGGRRALAVTAAGPVGIDLESVADISRAPVAEVLLSPDEADAVAALGPRAAADALAVLWTTKEAVLKAAGVGLRVDPRDLTIALDPAGEPGTAHRLLISWPDAPFPIDQVRLLPVAAPPGTVVTVAVVCARRPQLRLCPSAA
ncbi:4'-phosphopantetheinyl transferase superfamily protein [Cryobacterium sp. SO2]|uniref:4'-phosphopantetheinyl transferase family protein n=1 Tax=Cryobacterium sp. SO2 TaxID=1897060 RepID=UPI00223E1577|nr:4'-phosphopantetheinyl transferase superfamily protein [Cryobacterium sp. SO2]WEO76566.1 4'-phosphopantetheinyl transferase superfamily protein [Cryobacterium sp. SO2]